jgi:hypothetical protein
MERHQINRVLVVRDSKLVGIVTRAGAIFLFRSSTVPGGAMKTRTYFAFRIDVWDDAGDSIYERVVGSEDFEVAVAAYFAACQRWPKAKITLRQGARVMKKNWC